ncbi:MAG: DUF6268 family outer membrane beta-barrel protein [Verrucomicrobium sp.]|nr:DUF6268 family outer membrane beta-barrel protein [Verrucomicrobium sp.]
MKRHTLSVLLFLAAALSGFAQGDASMPSGGAGDSFSSSPAVPVYLAVPSTQKQAQQIHQELAVDYSYVGGSQARNGGTHYGDSDAQEHDVRYSALVPFDETWGMSFGVDYSRFDFGNPSTAAGLPQNIEAVVPNIGVRYKVDDQWALFGRFAPEIENLNNWSQSQYIRYTGALGAFYDVNPALQFTFGLAINPGTIKIPVMPLVGMRWKFADSWTLFVGFPKSSVEYRINPKWVVGAGPSFKGGVFRTDGDYGTASGRPDLNNQHFYYREIRVGVNTEYQFTPWMALDAEVGGSLYREFDFDDVGSGYKVKNQPAPYGQIGLKFRL